MIAFHKTYKTIESIEYIKDVLEHKISGDGKYTKLCEDYIRKSIGAKYVLMTTSGTHALELACFVAGLGEGDEVIIPSYTYPSTGNAVLMTGATIVYSEIDENSCMLDSEKLEAKITEKTKGIIPVHYGGMIGNMPEILALAKKHKLLVIEDAAQGYLAIGKDGKYGGMYGDMGCFSFHGTKDIIAGEGGAVVFKHKEDYEKAQIIRLKGTNSEAFNEGLVSRYEWVAKGTSYSPSELNMALLYSQLLLSKEILLKKQNLVEHYYKSFKKIKSNWQKLGILRVGQYDEQGTINGHIFYIVFKDQVSMVKVQKRLKEQGVETRTHFIPLHESRFGKKFIRENNHFVFESELGDRLLRLPLFPDLTNEEIDNILRIIEN